MRMWDGTCNKCGKFSERSAGCAHASCGGIFVASKDDQLRDKVYEALDNAVENGYLEELKSFTNEGLARDAMHLSSELEGQDFILITRFCKEYREKYFV